MKTIEINTANEINTIADQNAPATEKGDQSADVKSLATDQLLFVGGGENDKGW